MTFENTTSEVSNDILPPYRIIGQICILRQILTINFSQENMRYFTKKIIPLESSFEYESNDIIFI
jgi:hypothetical protein